MAPAKPSPRRCGSIRRTGRARRCGWQRSRTRADRPAPAYVARLFDDYAPRFERHLTSELGYRGPRILRDAVEAVAPVRRFRRALDLGCGSGLAGAAFRPIVESLAGVDLSPAMIEEARRTGVYDGLEVGDVAAFLAKQTSGEADLILAADVFVYLGDLAPTLQAAAAALSGRRPHRLHHGGGCGRDL